MTNKIILAGGIVLGCGALYALKNNIDYDLILERIEKNQQKFNEIVNTLIDFALEILEKIFTIIVELVRELIFKIKLYLH